MPKGLWIKVIAAVLFIVYVTAFNYGGCITVPENNNNNSGSSGNNNNNNNNSQSPSAPSSLVATTVSDSQVNLTWQNTSYNASIIKIERSSGTGFFQIATVNGNTTYYTDTGLNTNTTYYYRVRASNGYGESNPSNEVYVTTQAPATNTPNPPTTLSAIATSSYQINLTWTDCPNESGYKIERSTTAGSGFNQIATVNANVISYSDIGLIALTTYYYRVKSYNSQGDSSYSTQAYATTQTSTVTTPPPAPTSLNATAVSPYQINLSWTTPPGAQSIKIERSLTSNSGFNQINTVPGNTTSTYSDNNLSPSTLYYYRIKASNSAGDSGYSPQASAATQNPPSYSITGSVTGGTTGRTYIEVQWLDGGQTPYGTSIAGTGNFTIRGIQPGTYKLYAWRDHIGNGQKNASNPTGTVVDDQANPKPINVQGAVTGANVTLYTPPTYPTPVAPTNLRVYPGAQSALVFFDTSRDTQSREIAESYKLYYATDPGFTTANFKTIPANGDNNPPFITGLTDGTSYYFKISAVVGITESGFSTTVGPLIIGAPNGNYSVSGTVSFSGVTPTGPLYVGVYIDTPTGPVITYTRIASPTSPQIYTITAVANGTYQLFAVLDMNNNGVADSGDLQNTQGGPGGGLIIVNNSSLTNQDQTLSTANGIARVNTDHWRQGTNESYNVSLRVNDGRKLVVAVAMASGPGITGVTDICKRWEFEYWLNRSTRPTTADSYTFNVTYADGTTENLTSSVTAVLDTFAQNLTTTGTSTTPTFTWQAPASPPALYSYRFDINQTGTVWSQIWDYPKDTDMPSSQTSLVYNVDGRAYQSTLTTGTTYNWSIRVQDGQGNSASQQVSYTP
ncbi:MAG: fibronectin type III domain-containing protein [Planctomycetota bacterium]